MDVNHKYRCHYCNYTCASFRELHYHKNINHGGANLQEEPWLARHVPAPWEDGNNFSQLYNGNRSIILAPRRKIKPNKQVYNFPTDGLRRGTHEISDAMHTIF